MLLLLVTVCNLWQRFFFKSSA